MSPPPPYSPSEFRTVASGYPSTLDTSFKSATEVNMNSNRIAQSSTGKFGSVPNQKKGYSKPIVPKSTYGTLSKKNEFQAGAIQGGGGKKSRRRKHTKSLKRRTQIKRRMRTKRRTQIKKRMRRRGGRSKKHHRRR
jgi:hypothetical protein